jgi:hypothetical protein
MISIQEKPGIYRPIVGRRNEHFRADSSYSSDPGGLTTPGSRSLKGSEMPRSSQSKAQAKQKTGAPSLLPTSGFRRGERM